MNNLISYIYIYIYVYIYCRISLISYIYIYKATFTTQYFKPYWQHQSHWLENTFYFHSIIQFWFHVVSFFASISNWRTASNALRNVSASPRERFMGGMRTSRFWESPPTEVIRWKSWSLERKKTPLGNMTLWSQIQALSMHRYNNNQYKIKRV